VSSADRIVADRPIRRRAALGSAIGGAAFIIMLGNLTSSVLGYVRQAVMAAVFGANHATDAFVAASVVPQMFYDLAIGAAVGAALIPTFTAILERESREELWQTLGAVIGLVWLVLATLVVIIALAAQPVMNLLLIGYSAHLSPGQAALAPGILRILIVTLFFLGTSAVLQATLITLRRFVATAFASAFYHLGIIVAAVTLAGRFGIVALPIGAVCGAAAQVLFQIPSLFRQGLKFRPRLSFTPEVRRIIRLYLPVAAGLIVSIVGQIIDIIFKSELKGGTITEMLFATTLTQFPIGIGVAALSLAIMPSLSADAHAGRLDEFKDTLAAGLKFVVFLTVPAAVGYFVLSQPIVMLLYHHGHMNPVEARGVSTALLGYAIQIPFVGIDQLLIFAFYARGNTITPMLVGVAGVCVYIVAALALISPFGILGLALANTIQNSAHALVLLGLLLTALGVLSHRGVWTSLARTAVAAIAMAAGALGSYQLARAVAGGTALGDRLIDVALPVAIGGAIYLGTAFALRSDEVQVLRGVTGRISARGA